MKKSGRRSIDDKKEEMMINDRKEEMSRIVKRINVKREDEIEIMIVKIGKRNVEVSEKRIVENNVDKEELLKRSERKKINVIIERKIRMDGNEVNDDIGKKVIEEIKIKIGKKKNGKIGWKKERNEKKEEGKGEGDNREIILKNINVIIIW